jgi:microcystin-dependent protein
MGIYRGAGGSGDAINDSSSEALITLQARDAALAAQAAAEAAQVAAELAETNAETAETNAETAETNAETAETNAETAQAAAEVAQAAAEAAQAAAEAAQTAAELAETNAETAETNAETAQAAAATSATNASNSASAASTSATNASNSASAAATSATNAAASYDAFDDRYLGSKSSNPTVDNDGNALLTGALYYNTVSSEMRVWEGANWAFIGASGAAGVNSFNTRFGDITLTSSDVTTALTYTPLAPAAIGTTVQAYDADLTTLGAGGSSARSFLGLAIGTDVQAYDAQLADIAGLTPTDNSFIVGNGTNFVAEGASTARTSLGLGTAATTAATDYATAAQGTKADNALTAANPSYTGTLTGGTGVVNIGSGQVYKDASGNVGIGTSSPAQKLDIGGSGNSIMRLLAAGQGNGLEIGQLTSDGSNKIFAANNNYLAIGTNNTEQMRITSTGGVSFGSSGTAYGTSGQVLTSAGDAPPTWSSPAPVGSILFVAQNTAPSGYVKANGAALSRTTYADLFADLVTDAGFTSQTFTVTIASPAVFTKSAHGFTGGERIRLSTTGALPTGLNTTTDYFVIFVSANTFRVSTTFGGTAVNSSGSQSGTHSYIQSWYGLGDGSTTFNVPDLRAQFLRGWDDGKGIDTGRGFGTQQDDAFQSHTHTVPANGSGSSAFPATGLTGGGTLSTGATGGTETRPVNFAMLACIKF